MKQQKLDIRYKLTEDIRDFKAPLLAQEILNNCLEKDLLLLCLEKDHLLSSRAMWVLGHCSDIDYDRIKPFHEQLIDNLKQENLHNGVIRNTLGLFQQYNVPATHEAFMLDKCYGYIKNPSEAIAVRTFSVSVVYNISKPYPELVQELSIVLNHLSLSDEGPAIRARVKNTLKDIAKRKLKDK